MGTRALQVIALGALLIGVSAYLIPYGFQLQDNWNKTMRGELIPFQVNYTEPFTIQMGGIYVTATIEDLSKGFDLRQAFNFNDIEYPFQISFVDGKLLVSAEIRNANGDLVATVGKNQCGVSNNPVVAYDRNYNSCAFEVETPNQVPILQVVMTPQNPIFVGGVFYNTKGTFLAMLNGTTIINPDNSKISNYNQTIFQYPSDSHLGELALNSPFAFRPNPYSFPPIWVIVIGLVLLVAGTFITSSGVADKLKEKKRRARRREQRKNAQSYRIQSRFAILGTRTCLSFLRH